GLSVRFGFPYGSPEMNASDWPNHRKHKTTLTRANRSIRIHRQLDRDEYHVVIEWEGEASFDHDDYHQFLLYPKETRNRLAFVAAFSPAPINVALPDASATFAAAAGHWQRFWTSGAAVDLSESRD